MAKPNRVTFPLLMGFAAIATAGYYSRHDFRPWDWESIAALAILLLLLWWLLSPSVRIGAVDGEPEKGVRNNMAFRLGQFCKRILGR